MILFRIRLSVLPEQCQRIVKSALRLLGPTRALHGCLRCCLCQDIEDENTLLYAEEWESADALRTHLRSESLKVLLSIMDLAVEPPDIRFDTVTEMGGMEVIAAARAGPTASGGEVPGA